MDRWILKRLNYIRQSFSQSISPLSNHSSVSESTCKTVMWLKPSVSLSVKQPISSASSQLASQLANQLMCQSLSRLVGKWEDEWVSHSFVSQSLSRLVGKWEDEWVSHSLASHSISQSVSQSVSQFIKKNPFLIQHCIPWQALYKGEPIIYLHLTNHLCLLHYHLHHNHFLDIHYIFEPKNRGKPTK